MAAIAALAVMSTAACAAADQQPIDPPSPGPTHVHELAFSAEGNLLVATHVGLFEVAPSGGDSQQLGGVTFDAMGLAVVGTTVYASGHPAPESTADFAAPNVGLMTYASAEWSSVSAAGDADFHMLATSASDPNRIVAMRSDSTQLQISTDAGQTWAPGVSIEARDVAVDAGNPDVVVATTAAGLMVSSDGGLTMASAQEAPLLVTVAASGPGQIVGIGTDGQVWSGSLATESWEAIASIEPDAVAIATDPSDGSIAVLYEDALIYSRDGGSTWTNVAVPS